MEILNKTLMILGALSIFSLAEILCISLCKEKQNNRFAVLRQNPNVVDSPGGFFPLCDNKTGEFMAMQSNDNLFFCVSTQTGEFILNTEVKPGIQGKLITEEICQQYSALWNAFSDAYNKSSKGKNYEVSGENVTKSSCLHGFEYRSCDCPRNCVPGRNMTEMEMVCALCKPVCTCPTGYYQYHGECISADQCINQKTASNSLEVKISKWTTYFENNASNSLKNDINPIEVEETFDENWIEE